MIAKHQASLLFMSTNCGVKERTCPGLGPQDGQVDIGLPAINHGVGLPAGQLGPLPGRHHYLSQAEKTDEDFLAFLDKERKIER